MSKRKAKIWINLWALSVILCVLAFVGTILSVIWSGNLLVVLFLFSLGLIMLPAQEFCFCKASLEKARGQN